MRSLSRKRPPGLYPRPVGHGPGPRPGRPWEIHHETRTTGHGTRPVFVIPATSCRGITNTRQTPGRAAHGKLKPPGPRPGAGSGAISAQLREFRATSSRPAGRGHQGAAHGHQGAGHRSRARGQDTASSGARATVRGPGAWIAFFSGQAGAGVIPGANAGQAPAAAHDTDFPENCALRNKKGPPAGGPYFSAAAKLKRPALRVQLQASRRPGRPLAAPRRET